MSTIDKPSLTVIQQYIKKHRNRFIDELKDILRIPSISTKPKHKKDIDRCSVYVRDMLKKIGLQQSTIYPTNGLAVVYGEYIVNEKLPTVLVYGHYDVQPPDPLDLWDAPPFDPQEKEEKIIARGSADDKGQFMMHIKALEMMITQKSMPCNVKILIEGEEEIGSPSLEDFIRAKQKMLTCDLVLISDSAMHSFNTPTIDIGTRGLTCVEVEVIGPSRDLHSGVYGGAVANPITILCQMIASLHKQDKSIAIPGFYDNVQQVSKEERELLARLPYNENEYMKKLSIMQVYGEQGYTTNERTGIRPTLELNGIWGGYIEEGSKTVLPSKAHAKISCRLVPNQTAKGIEKLLKEHLLSITPECVKTNVHVLHGGDPYITPIDSSGYKAAEAAIYDTFGTMPLPTRGGGSIPIVCTFEHLLNVKTIFMGFGLNDDNIHSPNEKFNIANYLRGIETIPLFYHHYTKIEKERAASG